MGEKKLLAWVLVLGRMREEEGGGGGDDGDGDGPWPSSLKVSSRFSLSFSFFPRRLFLPPC